jgi:hypothetical protein
MKTFVEKLLYIFLLFAVFVVCLFGMAFLRNTLGLGVEWQMLIAIALAALWQTGEKWKERP